MCCSPWSCKELDTTLRLNNNSNKISWKSWVSFSQVVNDPNEWAGHFSWGQLYPKYMGWNRRRADGFRDLGWGTCRGACHPVKSKSCPLSSYRGRGGGCSVSSPILELFPVGEMTLVLFSYWPLVLMTEIAQVLDWEAQVSLRDCHSHQDNKPEDFLPAETLNGPSLAQYSLAMWSLSHHRECLPFRTWPS